ncbi:hypothetical protein A7A78_10870 [Aequorivita soesokkakensis]|uniref:Uncharacterized protein n=1 Tax=Aequorivita soesokkakensis TaxID=1385699 RepID=A0A1A9LG89_9FLAO|nr:hypothetical protein [Aequorivita soesokkakensis]OAD91751.1 hypothetical protein A7A78_10870 [Aequorivita soesokkakensis]
MNWKKTIKITALVIGFLVVAFVGYSSYIYYSYYGKYATDEEKYPHYIGFIDQNTALLNQTYSLCGDGTIYKTHHGAPFDAYKNNKRTFTESVLKTYKNEGYTDSGYVNFRFLVNCEGNPGWFEIIEINEDYEDVSHTKEMVDQLLKITSEPSHWAIYTVDGAPQNYYHYVSYKIENGEITEILP